MDSDEGYNYEFDEDEECSEDSGAEEDEEDDDEDEPDDNLDLGEVELVEPGLRVGGERDGLLGSETGGLGPGGGGGGGGLGGGPGPGGGGGPEQEEDYRYEVLTAEQILQHMVECIREVNEVIQNPATITRILLSHFNWDKEKLMERYFDGNLEKLFAECHVINPSKKSRTRQMNTRSSAQDMPCQICYLNYPNSYFTGLECGHKFCMQCWSEYLTTKIMEEGMGQTISCPAHGCDILVDDNTVMRLITDSKVKLKYQHLITNSFVECNRLLKWCPAPDCHHVVKVQYPDAKPVRCKCGRQFCFNCGENWHDPVKCKWLKKWIKKCDDDSETSNWIAANTKQENRAVVFGEGCLVPSQLFASVTASQSPNSVLNFFILKNLEGNRIRNAQNAMSPLRRTGAATTWSVGTRTAKRSSAGCVWALGSHTDLPGTTVIATMRMMQRQQGMHKRDPEQPCRGTCSTATAI
ncbi:E3 ubiquitin-protein ligase ARIH1 isoform X8 [Falco naumanni]|uniref:E3 ubiquitin-protein ligase ARIH1 isoform X8 n=1 Tax=Falco naumanni TaxID=148594 RepID=UPI001ADE6CF5|nr:E3 ubiquitin-protein ligase ARIH1 isoform X8 [Falco naumanni]